MVGFEQTVYTVPEGESVAICVQIITPPDIGTVQVFVEVVDNPGGVPTDLTEASKLSLLYRMVVTSVNAWLGYTKSI